jgi:peptide/nickel transport system substrate-binding protein
MMTFVDTISGRRPKTFTVKLKEHGSSSSRSASPRRRAVHDAEARRRDRSEHPDLGFHRLRPFVFKSDEWKPGDKAVYVKFDKYKPRSEPPRARGGKVVKVDRVEWLAISDQQQAVNALLAGRDRLSSSALARLSAAAEGRSERSSW